MDVICLHCSIDFQSISHDFAKDFAADFANFMWLQTDGQTVSITSWTVFHHLHVFTTADASHSSRHFHPSFLAAHAISISQLGITAIEHKRREIEFASSQFALTENPPKINQFCLDGSRASEDWQFRVMLLRENMLPNYPLFWPYLNYPCACVG